MTAKDLSKPFLDYLAQGELRYARNLRTGAALGYTARPDHGEPVEWAPAGGGGSLHTFAVYRQSYDPAFSPPYNVAVVQLDEGPLLLSTIEIDEEIPEALYRAVAALEREGKLQRVDGHLVWKPRSTGQPVNGYRNPATSGRSLP